MTPQIFFSKHNAEHCRAITSTLTKLIIIPALSPTKRTLLGSGEQLGSAFGPGFKLDRFWVSKAFKKHSPSSHKESCLAALAWKAAWKLKNLLVSFNLLRINPSQRIALVLWNYRVWHNNVFLLNLSLLHFLGKRNQQQNSSRRDAEGSFLDQEMCGGCRRISEAAELLGERGQESPKWLKVGFGQQGKSW